MIAFFRKKKSVSQKIKSRARRTLSSEISSESASYVVDTSTIINRFLPTLVRKGLKGRLIIPNALMAELENLANKGLEEGFIGLEEIAKLHKIKSIRIYFFGLRPNEMQIRFAKSGEIDALIREAAIKNNATLLTSDLVQAKSSQAYGLQVIYLKPKIRQKKKKKFWIWR